MLLLVLKHSWDICLCGCRSCVIIKSDVSFSPSSKGAEPEFRNPRVRLLWDRWRHVWMLAWERQRRLQDKLNYIQELDRVANFSWEDWRKRVNFIIDIYLVFIYNLLTIFTYVLMS